MRRLIPFALVASALACPAGVPQPDEKREATEEVRHRAQSERYYVISRLDYRKCMYPFCGGVFVAEVNEEESSCHGDVLQPDCYVSDVDWSALALSPDLESEVQSLARDGHVLIRGAIQPHDGGFDVGQLEVKAAWRGVTLNPPTGNWYQVKESGIVCITYPCPSISQLTLNTGGVESLGGLDLNASGASDDDIAAASNEIFGAGLMVSGTHDVVSGPAGDASQLVADEIYLPVGLPGGEPCGNTVCPAGETCCNASCSMCAPPEVACVQVACDDFCAHSECNQGSALDAACSSCATDVCSEDPFCCDQEWDGLCVQRAEQLCAACEPPPPPACEHSECSDGTPLEAACSACAAAVCAADSFCCDTAWDALCVQQAEASCDVCEPPAPTCAHDTCAEGPALEQSCSTCATAVCDADPYCCSAMWDGICVSEADGLCGGC